MWPDDESEYCFQRYKSERSDMRNRKIKRLAMSALVMVTVVAIANAQQGPPKPAAEMSQLASFEGTWTCKGKSFDTPMGPAGPLSSTAVIRKDLGGHFQTGTIKGTMPNMPPFEGRFNVTYDTGTKEFVMLWVDNMGGRAESKSRGWKGDALVYEGQGRMGGQTMGSRDTFTKTGATSLKHTWDVQMDGKWMPAGEETCTKK
jgi:hypothetical protein